MSKIAIRYFDNKDDALSSINLAFFKLLKSLQNFDISLKLSPYLNKILINQILEDLKIKNSVKVSFFDVEEIENYNDNFSLNKGDEQLEYNDIISILGLLPDLHRSVFNLFVIDGYTHQQIASMLQISEPYSKWLLFDTKKRLIKVIREINCVGEKIRKEVV